MQSLEPWFMNLMAGCRILISILILLSSCAKGDTSSFLPEANLEFADKPRYTTWDLKKENRIERNIIKTIF